MSDWPDEQTDDPLYADDRNFYKVEAWSRDGNRIDALLYAGNDLRKAQQTLLRPSGTGPHQADHPAANAGVAAVAAMKSSSQGSAPAGA